jgi:hypothetical protein
LRYHGYARGENLLKTILDRPDLLKPVFDHFKNITVSMAILAGAIWTYRNVASAPSSISHFIGYWATVSLGVIGIALFVINEIHWHRAWERARLPLAYSLLFHALYGGGIFSFVFSLLSAAFR